MESEMIEITLKRTLDDGFISDVLITAFDGSYGACWYWCRPFKGQWLHRADDNPERWAECRIVYEDEDGNRIVQVANAAVVQAGIQQILSDKDLIAPYIRENIFNAILESDAGYIDAEAADCIVQVGLLSNVVYG